MYCPYCRNLLPQGARFCGNCGKPVSSQPNVQNQIPYNHPQGQTAWKTVPVNQNPGRVRPSDYPTTQPVNCDPKISPEQMAHCYPQGNQNPVPMRQQQGSQHAPPKIPDPYQPEVNPAQPVQIRKLPLLVAAVAIVLMVILALKPSDNNVVETGPAQSETKSSAAVQEKPEATDLFPEGKLRVTENGFLFDNQEFEGLFAESMSKREIPFTLGQYILVEGCKYNYPVQYNGEEVGYLIVTLDTATGLAENVSITYYLQENEELNELGVMAALSLIEIGHGAMTDEKWDQLVDVEPIKDDPDYTLYIYRLDGMKASLTIRPDRVFLNVSAE